jgi:DNA-binding CsgD family transcriptional regulator
MTLVATGETREELLTDAALLSTPQADSALQVRHALACLAETLAAVGQPEFYNVLASELSPLFRCDRYLAMRYNRYSKPAFLFNRSFSHSAGELYLNSLYEHDPLYRKVLEGIPTQVLTLQSTDGQIGRSSYRAALLRYAQISDELAILLPIAEETAVAVCFNHAAGRFDDDVVVLAEAIYPVLREANRLHLERLSQAGTWDGQIARSGMAGESLRRKSRCELLKEFCSLRRLSVRERQLLMLTLEGLANRLMASRLHLAVGTVKNYKRRLYRKLGVCSERALLRMVANFLASGHAV